MIDNVDIFSKKPKTFHWIFCFLSDYEMLRIKVNRKTMIWSIRVFTGNGWNICSRFYDGRRNFWTSWLFIHKAEKIILTFKSAITFPKVSMISIILCPQCNGVFHVLHCEFIWYGTPDYSQQVIAQRLMKIIYMACIILWGTIFL